MALDYVSFCTGIQTIDSSFIDEKYKSAVDNIILKYGYKIKENKQKVDVSKYAMNLALCLVNKNTFDQNIIKFLNDYGFEKIEHKVSIKDLYTKFYYECKTLLLKKQDSLDKASDELLKKIKMLQADQSDINEKFPSLTDVYDKYDDLVDDLRSNACDMEDEMGTIDEVIEQMNALNTKILSLTDD